MLGEECTDHTHTRTCIHSLTHSLTHSHTRASSLTNPSHTLTQVEHSPCSAQSQMVRTSSFAPLTWCTTSIHHIRRISLTHSQPHTRTRAHVHAPRTYTLRTLAVQQVFMSCNICLHVTCSRTPLLSTRRDRVPAPRYQKQYDRRRDRVPAPRYQKQYDRRRDRCHRPLHSHESAAITPLHRRCSRAAHCTHVPPTQQGHMHHTYTHTHTHTDSAQCRGSTTRARQRAAHSTENGDT
jgi:hypothetical protein